MSVAWQWYGWLGVSDRIRPVVRNGGMEGSKYHAFYGRALCYLGSVPFERCCVWASTLCGGDAGEAISETLLVLVLGVLEETVRENRLLAMQLSRVRRLVNHVRGGLGGLQESLPADLADDAHGLLIL